MPMTRDAALAVIEVHQDVDPARDQAAQDTLVEKLGNDALTDEALELLANEYLRLDREAATAERSH